MTLLAATQIVDAGITPAYAAVSASDTIAVDSNGYVLHVLNAGGSADTVTIVDAGSTGAGNAAVSRTVSVPATTGSKLIHIPPQATSATTGLVTITHSFTTTVTYALWRVN